MDDSDEANNVVAVDDEGDGQAAAAADVDTADSDSDESEEHFDISLAASHSYMGEGLVEVRGRVLLEPGWIGRVPALAHHGAVFPGETVPMLLPDAHDAELIGIAIQHDKLFGLLCPDESGTLISGYGVLCEVFEAALEPSDVALSFKARAVHRFRLVGVGRGLALRAFSRVRPVRVRVLPEVAGGGRGCELGSLVRLRGRPNAAERLRRMDAALTAWPPFVYDIFDYERMRAVIEDHFRTLMLASAGRGGGGAAKLPLEPVPLSFWVASNLPLRPRDRLALFAVDNALLRLHMEVQLIAKRAMLCCCACLAEVARRDHIFAMSSDGVHSNYTNLGGFVHDVVTVSAARAAPSGAASAEYSWFPGYAWTVALCPACMAHIGWRFDALKKNLRPQQFYGLCRNYVQPRHDDGDQ